MSWQERAQHISEPGIEVSLLINVMYVGTHSSEAADGKVIPTNGDLDGLDVLSECQLLYVFDPASLSPVTTIKKDNLAVEIL